MFALFGEQAEISEELTSNIFNPGCTYLSSLDLHGEVFKSTPETRLFEKHKYLPEDDTYEDVHPLAYSTKVHSHAADNPTYSNILRCEDGERKLWDEAIIKELKSLRDLGSFKMVPRPR